MKIRERDTGEKKERRKKGRKETDFLPIKFQPASKTMSSEIESGQGAGFGSQDALDTRYQSKRLPTAHLQPIHGLSLWLTLAWYVEAFELRLLWIFFFAPQF